MYPPRTILAATVASGSMDAIKHVVTICEKGDLYSDSAPQVPYTLLDAFRSNQGYNILYLAVEGGNIPAVVFLLEKCAALSLNPGDIPRTQNIFQLAKSCQNVEMIIAIRETCERLDLKFTPHTPNSRGKSAIQDPKCDVEAVNDALIKPLNELKSPQLVKPDHGG